MPSVVHCTDQDANNRAEVSHLLTRQREHQMRRFTSAAHAQRFFSVRGPIQNLFRIGPRGFQGHAAWMTATGGRLGWRQGVAAFLVEAVRDLREHKRLAVRALIIDRPAPCSAVSGVPTTITSDHQLRRNSTRSVGTSLAATADSRTQSWPRRSGRPVRRRPRPADTDRPAWSSWRSRSHRSSTRRGDREPAPLPPRCGSRRSSRPRRVRAPATVQHTRQ